MFLLEHVVYQLKSFYLVYERVDLSGSSYWGWWLGFSRCFQLSEARAGLRSFDSGMLR